VVLHVLRELLHFVFSSITDFIQLYVIKANYTVKKLYSHAYLELKIVHLVTKYKINFNYILKIILYTYINTWK